MRRKRILLKEYKINAYLWNWLAEFISGDAQADN